MFCSYVIVTLLLDVDVTETLREQEEKWPDLGLQNLQESPRHNWGNIELLIAWVTEIKDKVEYCLWF